MKIGIITLPLHNNYGGILQAYALQKVLQSLGHDAIIIDRSRFTKLSRLTRLKYYFKNLFQKIFVNPSIVVCCDNKENYEAKVMATHTYPFLLKYLKRLEADPFFSDILPSSFDAFVVGSDQVWRPKYFGAISCAFLHFAKKWSVKRLSYAASFGTDEWEYTEDQTNLCRELIKKFDAVSVREGSAIKLCKENFGVDALHVLDPTMLLNVADYIKLFTDTKTPQSMGTLMCYVLNQNEDKQKVISFVEHTLNISAFSVNSKYEDPTAPLEERIQPPVETWLRGFYDAEFVITDSFHACVFSILFEKPFIVYGNKERGLARFYSLLSIFGLENRLITNSEDAQKVMTEFVDWNAVNNKKKEWQEKSLNFLKNNL